MSKASGIFQLLSNINCCFLLKGKVKGGGIVQHPFPHGGGIVQHPFPHGGGIVQHPFPHGGGHSATPLPHGGGHSATPLPPWICLFKVNVSLIIDESVGA